MRPWKKFTMCFVTSWFSGPVQERLGTGRCKIQTVDDDIGRWAFDEDLAALSSVQRKDLGTQPSENNSTCHMSLVIVCFCYVTSLQPIVPTSRKFILVALDYLTDTLLGALDMLSSPSWLLFSKRNPESSTCIEVNTVHANADSFFMFF